MYSAHAQWYASCPWQTQASPMPGGRNCSNASAESILMCGFGTPVFSHFCPEAFGRGKRIVESGGAQSVPAPGTAESRCPVEGRLINPYHRTSDIIYLNE